MNILIEDVGIVDNTTVTSAAESLRRSLILRLSTTTDVFSGQALDLEDVVDRIITYLNDTSSEAEFMMFTTNNGTLKDPIDLIVEYLNAIKNNSVIVTEVLDMVRLLSPPAASNTLSCFTRVSAAKQDCKYLYRNTTLI